jgi:diguanylate cyclase (GGDEF)-like protein
MQIKPSHNLFLRLTTWLLLATSALAVYFIYLTYQHSQQSIKNNLIQQANATSEDVTKALSLGDQYLQNYSEHITASSVDTPHVITSQYFSKLTAYLYSGNTVSLYGQLIPAPIINTAIASHLARNKSAIISARTNDTDIKLYMLHAFADQQGYLVAEINIATLLSKTNTQQSKFLRLVNNRLHLIQANEILQNNQLKPLISSTSRFQHGFVTLNGKQETLNTYFTTTKTIQHYAIPDLAIVISQPNPPLMSMLVNQSFASMAIFVSLVGIFSLLSLRKKLTDSIRRKSLDVSTIQSRQKFVRHLDSLSAMDTAILAGVKFDEITEISLRQVLSTIPSSYAGIVKLPATKKDLSEIYLMDAKHEKKVLHQKLDKVVLNLINQHLEGHVLENVEESIFFTALLQDSSKHVLLLPIFKEGAIDRFLFSAFDEKHALTDFELGCFKNISQHLGVALTAISQSEKLYVKEYFDPVSGLFNQQACRERLSQEMSRARRKKQKIAVFQLNLIGYKKINETFGYLMGDQLLKEVGTRLKNNLRDTDILARLGGDDFVIISADIDKVTHANRLADKLIKLLGKPIGIFDHAFNVSSAIGISIYPQDGITVDEILNHANLAMNKAKKMGPNQYAFYEDNLSANDAWRISLEKDLRSALTNNELFLKYQPQTNPRSRKVCGVEALVRWKHPERGLIKPIEFISLAEETGLIVEIGQFARKAAFAQYMEWKRTGIEIGTISVNVSSYEMQRLEFMPDILSLISETGINPTCIELEITESLMLELSGNVMQNLTRLHELGIRIAIDDFGTGYSNLSYLGRLPFDVLKIDKSFMHGIGMQSSANQIVSMMIDMAHHLGKSVCAEGVENDTQYQFLETAGCDILQGFYLSKPLLAKDFAQYIQNMQSDQLIYK